MEHPKHFVELEVINGDDDGIEVRFNTSNIKYSGFTECYIDLNLFQTFIEQLKGFPITPDCEDVIYEPIKVGRYFSIKFQIKNDGHAITLIEIADVGYERNNKLYIEIYVEPASIDNFQKQLATLFKNRKGKAMLIAYK
jgi:hypothetical protein